MLHAHSLNRIGGLCGLRSPRITLRSQLRQTKIENLRVTSFRHKDIGRLDVAVDDACGVGSIQSIGDLNRQTEQNIRLNRLSRDALLQSDAVQEFHDDISAAVLFADIVNGADVGMVECRRRLGLAPKAFKCLRVACHFVRKEFEADGAMKSGVLGLVDHTHPTAAKFFKDAVVGNRSPGEWRRVGHWREYYSAPNGKST